MTHHSRDNPLFFLTVPAPCPYLDGLEEQKIFTHLSGEGAVSLNNLLTEGGFRRSQSVIYRPACNGCSACISTRVLAEEFTPSKSFSRVLKANADLIGEERECRATSEQYSLFRDYLATRHADGGMADMSAHDFAMMIEDTRIETMVVEYRKHGPDSTWTGRGEGKLYAVALIDILNNGLSMVYSFFSPEDAARSLGTFLILDHIARARRRGLRHLYLGYWVAGSRKMAYKARFLPQERLTLDGWQRVP